jgi:hypothetical protein
MAISSRATASPQGATCACRKSMYTVLSRRGTRFGSRPARKRTRAGCIIERLCHPTTAGLTVFTGCISSVAATKAVLLVLRAVGQASQARQTGGTDSEFQAARGGSSPGNLTALTMSGSRTCTHCFTGPGYSCSWNITALRTGHFTDAIRNHRWPGISSWYHRLQPQFKSMQKGLGKRRLLKTAFVGKVHSGDEASFARPSLCVPR